MKKIILLLPMLLVGLSLPTSGASASNDFGTSYINDGKILNGRTLVPLRIISEEFGSKVEWNQKNKTVKINDDTKETVLTANSKKITVNGKPSTIDAPVQIDNGKTYVPLVVASPTGSAVVWNQKDKIAGIYLKGKNVYIDIASANDSSKVHHDTKLALIKKADEIVNLSSIKQVRTHFKPYFTDPLINKVIYQKGFEGTSKFKNAGTGELIVYTNNKALIRQVLTTQNGSTTEYYVRTLVTLKVNGVWKVDDIYFQESFHDGQMNG